MKHVMRVYGLPGGDTLLDKLISLKAKVLVTQSCPTLCDPMDCSPPGSTVHGFSRQEYWSGFPFPIPGDIPNPGIKLHLLYPCIAGGFFTIELPGTSHF